MFIPHQQNYKKKKKKNKKIKKKKKKHYKFTAGELFTSYKAEQHKVHY